MENIREENITKENTIQNTEEFENKVKYYWTERVHYFSAVRKNEMKDSISDRWLEEIYKYLPKDKNTLKILDVGTGSGYFALLLAKKGHLLTGIDLTEAMIQEAKQIAEEEKLSIDFRVMDAQQLEFADNSFDVVITRNLTWTLTDSKKAYQEWYRVLRPNGVLMNFDANYAQNVRNHKQKDTYISSHEPYGHIGMTKELEQLNADITLGAEVSCENRPLWDMKILHQCGFSVYGTDVKVGKRVIKEKDLSDAPIFMIYGKK